ncbi:MAG: hypothetical protein NZ577_03985, partial [Vicinamibacterales bacterium]|nr:hypothetical protein [Vicinamibacterales bacterium]
MRHDKALVQTLTNLICKRMGVDDVDAWLTAHLPVKPHARVEGEAVEEVHPIQSKVFTTKSTPRAAIIANDPHQLPKDLTQFIGKHGWHSDGASNPVWSGTDVSIVPRLTGKDAQKYNTRTTWARWESNAWRCVELNVNCAEVTTLLKPIVPWPAIEMITRFVHTPPTAATQRRIIAQATDPDELPGDPRCRTTALTVNLTKRKTCKEVEEHFDDCGEDVSSIMLATAPPSDTEDECVLESDMDELMEPFGDGLSEWYFLGSDVEDTSHLPAHPKAISFDDLDSLGVYLTSRLSNHTHVDCVEVCGGAAGVSRIAIRRHVFSVGRNFDLVTHVDLSTPEGAQQLFRYLERTKPTVMIASPPCTGNGGWSFRNRWIDPEAWERLRERTDRIARTVAHAMDIQLRARRHALVEQPYPSQLYDMSCFLKLYQKYGLVRAVFDQCLLGLVNPVGQPVRKRSEVWASSLTLICRLGNVGMCDGTCHKHAHIEGKIDGIQVSKYCQVWPKRMCELIVMGIADLLADYRRQLAHLSYPATVGGATGSDGTPDGSAVSSDPPWWHKCIACKRRWRMDHKDHSRIDGECKYPHVESRTWECPACDANLPRNHPDHNDKVGECRWVLADHRTFAPRSSGKRRGAHPRDGRLPAEEESTTAEPTVPGAHTDDVTAAQESLADLELEGDPAPTIKGPTAPPADGGEWTDDEETGERKPRTRGPYGPRKVTVETGIGGGAQWDNPDWTTWDLGLALKILRSGTDVQKRRTIRKLHVRWWHSSSAAMKSLFEAAGVPTDVIDLIQPIIGTCKICRMWVRPGNKSIATYRISVRFNETLQFDLLFVYDWALAHAIDEAIRWSVVGKLPDRTSQSI